ncbi:MAG: outer membrane beta-barrel protein [Gammaproteobacteria bacterium]|nr:outer membrane beta-barrel protein [Gammaproteobacteria bacterium]
MNKLTKISATLLASLAIAGTAHAAKPGAYVGGAIGLSSLETNKFYQANDINPVYTSAKITRTSGGLGGKIFAGYTFTQNFGIEAAFAKYAGTKETLSASNGFSSTSQKYTHDLSAISLVGKAYLPFGEGSKFNLYALAGAAEVFSKANNPAVPANVYYTSPLSGSKTTHTLRPVYGIGASYDINSKLTANAELSRIQGKGNTRTSLSAIPDADMLNVGLAYNFG